MIGNGSDWWNRNTPEDDILMQLVEIAKELVHLPQLEEIPERQRRSLMGSCVTYFGSFEGARKKVARLLYGRADLICPDDLLPSEAKLPLTEQEAIRERRQGYYQEMLKKLSEPDALAKMRREQAEEEKRRKYERETAGYTVRKIPIQTRRELRAVIGEEELQREAKSTSGLFARRPEKQKPVADGAKPQKGARFTDGVVKPLAELLMQQLKNATITIEGGNDEMARQRITREAVLNALSEMVEHYGHMPTRMEMAEYSSAHEDERIPGAMVMSKNLGPKNTWMAQLEEYQRSKMPEAGESSDGPVPDSSDGSPDGTSPDLTGGPSDGSLPDSLGESSFDSMPSGEAAGESGVTPGPELEPVPSAKVMVLDLNLQSVQLNFRLNGQEYTMNLRFGGK